MNRNKKAQPEKLGKHSKKIKQLDNNTNQSQYQSQQKKGEKTVTSIMHVSKTENGQEFLRSFRADIISVIDKHNITPFNLFSFLLDFSEEIGRYLLEEENYSKHIPTLKKLISRVSKNNVELRTLIMSLLEKEESKR